MDQFEKYLNLALRYLSYRPRSEKELKDYLKKSRGARSGSARKNIDPEIIEAVIEKLKEQKFLDDKEFVQWWIEQRTKFKTKGLRLIKLELLKKGVSKDIVDDVIKGSEGLVDNDLDRAKKILEKRIGRYRGLAQRDLYQKLGAFLGRRGFDWDTIKQAIDDTIKKGV